MEAAIIALGALAQETRLSIFRALVRAHSPVDGEGGLAAGEIGEALDVPSATLSFHLKEMSHAGLVASRREGRSIIYKADLGVMRGLTDFYWKIAAREPAAASVHANVKRSARDEETACEFRDSRS